MTARFLRQTGLLDWLAALFLFLLLREWLLPLPELTDTADLSVFMYILGGALLLDMIGKWRSLTFVLKMLGILWLLHDNFFVTPFFDTEWIKELLIRLQSDLPLALQQNWVEMSPVSRNALFYLMLMLMVSLLSYLVLEQRQGLWFVFISEAYLAVLDTFMPYEADGAIIRTLIYGFLLLAVIHISSLDKWMTGNSRSRFSYVKSLLAPVLIISLTVGVAYGAPKKAASWPDPIAYFTGGNGAGTTYMKKVGYDNNDNRLGGPFIQDNSLIFTATTNEKTYWRGDSKDIYTGWGWQKGDREHEPILDPKSYQWKDILYSGMEMKEVKASLEFRSEQFPTIFYPGQIKQLTGYAPTNATLMYDKEYENLEVRDGKIQMYITDNAENRTSANQTLIVPNTLLMKLYSYEVTAEVPIISEKQMVAAGTDYPREIRDHYLQLPEKLPPRVRELALQVTKDAKSPYEKARAIESFLRSGQYKYETEDVPVPEQGQDFVDQFLFESFRGYCDHFSTSMAVMLRSIGIPTRWVKGFATGTDVGDDAQGNEIIEVRNRDAHSWVEVYFPQYGWIPFEATSSFLSPLRVKYDLFTELANVPATSSVNQPQTNDRADGREERMEEDDLTIGSGQRVSWPVPTVILVLVGAALFVGWQRRRRIFVWWLQRKMATYQEQNFPQKYQVLLSMFEHVVAKRHPGETLREYVNRLSISGDKRQDLFYLTQLFERALYGYKDIGERARAIANKMIDQLSQQMKP